MSELEIPAAHIRHYPFSPNELKAFRERHGLTQGELATVVGRSAPTVSAWESGATPPDLGASRLLGVLDGQPSILRSLSRNAAAAPTVADRWRTFLVDAPAGIQYREIAGRDGAPDLMRENHSATMTLRVADLVTLTRDLNTAQLVKGGALVGESLTEIRTAQALESSLAPLGVRYQTLADKRDAVAAVITPPEGEWLLEGDSLTETGATLTAARAPLKLVGAALSMSRRLVQQGGPEAERAIARAVWASLLRSINAAIVAGDGNTQPLGILAQCPSTALSGAFDADGWHDAVEALEVAGVESGRIGVAASPGTKKILSGVQFDGRNLWRAEGGRQWCAGHPAAVSNAVPDGTLLVGDFSTVTAHHAAELDLRLRQTRADGAHELFYFLDVALSVPEPAAFLALTGVVGS